MQLTEKKTASQQIRESIARHDLTAESPALVLGQRKQSGKIVGGKYPVQSQMANRLREVAISAEARIAIINMTDYDGATLLDPENGQWVPASRLRAEAPLLKFLDAIDDDQEPISADEAQSLSLSLYAIAFGTEADRLFFVREKAQHFRGSGKIFGMFDGPLRLVTEPMLSLDTHIDFILTDVGAVVFNAHAFERFIQDPAEIAGHFATSLHDFSKQLPVAAKALEIMKTEGVGSLSMRGRVRSILSRPYFINLTLERVREKIVSKKLDPDRFIRGDQLNFDARDTMLVLKLLDQKVWLGDFDDTLYSTNAATPEHP